MLLLLFEVASIQATNDRPGFRHGFGYQLSMKLGYFLSCEEFGPDELVAVAVVWSVPLPRNG